MRAGSWARKIEGNSVISAKASSRIRCPGRLREPDKLTAGRAQAFGEIAAQPVDSQLSQPARGLRIVDRPGKHSTVGFVNLLDQGRVDVFRLLPERIGTGLVEGLHRIHQP